MAEGLNEGERVGGTNMMMGAVEDKFAARTPLRRSVMVPTRVDEVGYMLRATIPTVPENATPAKLLICVENEYDALAGTTRSGCSTVSGPHCPVVPERTLITTTVCIDAPLACFVAAKIAVPVEDTAKPTCVLYVRSLSASDARTTRMGSRVQSKSNWAL